MQERISPAASVQGTIRLPGDKSISHRYALLAAISEGPSLIRNYSSGADCHSTLGCLRGLGVQIEQTGLDVTVHGRGLRGLCPPAATLDAGNSGSTIRMLSGILSGQNFQSRVAGDASLSRRPMARIMKPLGLMGARIAAREGQFPPLEISGGPLKSIDYSMPVASAQVKSCVLFAGLYAEGVTMVREPAPTRDHTEIALREFGASVSATPGEASIHGGGRLRGCELHVPGDLSSAAFFLVAALISRAGNLVIREVGLNPTRAALLEFLIGMGADIRILEVRQRNGEPVGDLLVKNARCRGGRIEGALTAALIDEIPVLAVLGAASEEGLLVRDARELRVKETDRIATVAENCGRMGVALDVFDDGFFVPGGQRFRGAEVHAFGDHRIAMAFAVAGLGAQGETVIEEAEAASVSFPEFYGTLRTIAS